MLLIINLCGLPGAELLQFYHFHGFGEIIGAQV